MFNWISWLKDKPKPVPAAPDFTSDSTLKEYAVAFDHLKNNGLGILLNLLDSKAAASIRTFRDVSSHTEMCKLQGEIQAYMSVRDVVETIIKAYQQRLEDKKNGE